MQIKAMLALMFSVWSVYLAGAQEIQFEKQEAGVKSSFRGISVPTDDVAWVSGTGGVVLKTTDSGKNWSRLKVSDKDSLDFRSIYAIDDQKAYVANAGSPSYIYRTEDGGETWKQVFEDVREESFIDAICLWDSLSGIAFGDPIEGRLRLLRTRDGGYNWEDISQQADVGMKAGEAGFAASGTAMRLGSDGKAWIGTGGSQARLLFSYNYGDSWSAYPVPIEQGDASQGIFSLAVINEQRVIAVGGDYKMDRNNTNVIRISSNGSSWEAPKSRLSGYKSSAESLGKDRVLATGTSGTDFSTDGGVSWKNIDQRPFNVVAASPSGTFILIAGAEGALYRLSFSPVQ